MWFYSVRMAAKLMMTIIIMVVVVAMPTRGSDTSCTNPAPGTAKLIRGVDISTLDLIPLDNINKRGIKAPILNFTCYEGKTWKSSSDGAEASGESGTDYQLPDQVWHMTSVSGGSVSTKVNVFRQGSDVRKWMINNVGGEGGIYDFAFSSSLSYKQMETTIQNTAKTVIDVTAFEAATRVDMAPEWTLTLDNFAQVYVDNYLTDTYEANRHAYKRFIEVFGTHYFARADFGGLIRKYIEISKEYLYSNSREETEANAKAAFMDVFSASAGTNSGSKKVSNSFKNATSTSVKYYGGKTNFFTKDGINTWQSTVDKNPWLFSGNVRPISELIFDKKKRDNLDKAVKQHVLDAYVEDLDRRVAAAKRKVVDKELDEFQTKLQKIKEKTILDEDGVRRLGNYIDGHLIVPAWFEKDTKFCFKWDYKFEKYTGECGGKGVNPATICSNVNGKTEYYLDDTDYHRDAGCQMQWGLMSHDQYSWLTTTEICFRYTSDDSECGTGASSTRKPSCARVNSYTYPYVDNSQGYGQGCGMSWMIKVPKFAPMWLRTSQLCYFWLPTGHQSQCQASSRKLCATANTWTPTYTDSTDNDDGGCKMSWGLFIQL